MRPWVDRLTYPSTSLHYIVDLILNFLIAAGLSLLMLGVLLYAS